MDKRLALNTRTWCAAPAHMIPTHRQDVFVKMPSIEASFMNNTIIEEAFTRLASLLKGILDPVSSEVIS